MTFGTATVDKCSRCGCAVMVKTTTRTRRRRVVFICPDCFRKENPSIETSCIRCGKLMHVPRGVEFCDACFDVMKDVAKTGVNK